MVALPRGQISASPIEAILQWMWDRSRSKTLHELRASGRKEAESIAKVSGLTVAEFRRLAKLGPHAPDLLERRMAALGLDPGKLVAAAPQRFHDLQRVCSFCEAQGRCLRDLAHDPAIPAWKDYCPNAKTLLAIQAAGRHATPKGGAP
jgi:hypothetical protein